MAGKGGANLAKFAALIEQMTHEAQILPLPELVDHVIYHSGLLAHYQNERDGVDRLENLQELVNAAQMFVSDETFDGMPAGRIPDNGASPGGPDPAPPLSDPASARSEEHTSELQTLMRNSYTVFCINKTS